MFAQSFLRVALESAQSMCLTINNMPLILQIPYSYSYNERSCRCESWCLEKPCIKSSKKVLSIKHSCKRLSASRAIDSVQQPASYHLATLQLMHTEGEFNRLNPLIWIDFGERHGNFDRICRVSESTTISAWLEL